MKKQFEDKNKASEQSHVEFPQFAPYLINRIAHRYNQSVQDIMNEKGLTVPKMRAVAALAAQGDLTVNELTVYAVAEQSTMSRTIDQMYKDGLITRKVSVDDQRVRVISLTEDGHDLFQRIWPEMQRAEAELLKGLDEKTKTTLLETLNTILGNIRVNDF